MPVLTCVRDTKYVHADPHASGYMQRRTGRGKTSACLFSGYLANTYSAISARTDSLQANQILGLAPGEVFVQRNIGNLATHKDLNCMTCLEYAVNVLKVKHVIVCGHYNCGAIRGALTMSGKTPGLTNLWISDIKDTRNKHAEQLGKLEGDAQMNRYEQQMQHLLPDPHTPVLPSQDV